MRLPTLIAAALRLHVTPRTAALVAAPAPLLLAARGGWTAAAAAAVWLAVVAAMVVRDASLAARPSDLEWTRSLPVRLSIGVPNLVELTVSNRSFRPARIVARETPPPGFAGDRAIGPFVLAPGDEHVASLHLTPPSRGLFRFGGVGVRSLGPWRLAGWQAQAQIAEDAKVYPDIQAVRSYALLARKGALAEMGVKRMRYAGEGTEFESLRDYRQGDSFRDMDWKATARRGRPIVRAFEAERSQTMVLAVDAGRLMMPRVTGMSKLDRAINAALLLAYLGTEHDDLVGLLVFGRDVVRYLPPRKGHRQFLAILDALYSVEGKVEEPDYDRAMRYLSGRLPRRSLVVIFTDLAGRDASKRLLDALAGLSPRHLPLLVTQRNRDIEAKSRTEPRVESDVFEASVAETLIGDKAAALRLIAARGALVLDVHPEELTVATVNRYLEVKARGRL
jgi:uncharacterized protein (DUF58 family)